MKDISSLRYMHKHQLKLISSLELAMHTYKGTDMLVRAQRKDPQKSCTHNQTVIVGFIIAFIQIIL